MSGARWQQLQQAGECPGPRSSHCMAYSNGRIYLFGGELQPRVPVPAATYVYDLASGTWRKLETARACPGPRVAATMTAIGSKLYLFGGRTGVDMGEGATCDLFTLDINTATWSAAQLNPTNATTGTTAAPAAPPARSYPAMAAAGGQLYVFGGCSAAGRLADLWQYDPAAGAWLQLPGCASVGARGGSVMVASGDGSQLFVMGGFNGDEMRDCHSYNIATSTWSCPTCCDTDSTAAPAAHSTDATTAAAHQQHISSLTMPLARSLEPSFTPPAATAAQQTATAAAPTQGTSLRLVVRWRHLTRAMQVRATSVRPRTACHRQDTPAVSHASRQHPLLRPRTPAVQQTQQVQRPTQQVLRVQMETFTAGGMCWRLLLHMSAVLQAQVWELRRLVQQTLRAKLRRATAGGMCWRLAGRAPGRVAGLLLLLLLEVTLWCTVAWEVTTAGWATCSGCACTDCCHCGYGVYRLAFEQDNSM